MLEFTKDHSACDLRMRWEKNTEQRMVSATIERRVHEAMEQYEKSIDERRERYSSYFIYALWRLK